jgi:hypothetical protein
MDATTITLIAMVTLVIFFSFMISGAKERSERGNTFVFYGTALSFVVLIISVFFW